MNAFRAVNTELASMRRSIDRIGRALAGTAPVFQAVALLNRVGRLRAAGSRTVGKPKGTEGGLRDGSRKARRSPAAIRRQRLQGQYLGALRSLTTFQRDTVMARYKQHGAVAAIKVARKYKKANLVSRGR